MFVILLSLVAACAAAPSLRLHHHGDHFAAGPPQFHPQPPQGPGFASSPRRYDSFDGDIFDTRQFWTQMSTELRQLDDILAQFYEKFPSISSSQGIDGNLYKVNIPLSGFDEKDIVVKAREGLLMVQAVHKLGGEANGQSSYLDIKTLPSCVNVTGSWTYEENVLKIVFPLKPQAVSEEEDVTEEPLPAAHSREEMAPARDVEGDVDVGARGDQDSDRELITNEIPRRSVEATTYAVDLKDDVEFVPVRYNK